MRNVAAGLLLASPGDPVVGEDVWFTNESENAVDYEWDFGDGYISDEPNPIHRFTSTGVYNVRLKVWSAGGLSDVASLDLDVKIPTLLEIEVLEYFDKYPVGEQASCCIRGSSNGKMKRTA